KAPQYPTRLDSQECKGSTKDDDRTTKAFGLEVFRDENTGNVIYISETGSIAVVPGKEKPEAPTKKPSEPVWTHGLDLKCREYGKKNFTDKNAKLYGIEVFTEENNGCIIYICETGAVTAVAKE